MAEANDTYTIIHQNLIDAGCEAAMIEKCLLLAKSGKALDMLPLLINHRKRLLDYVHNGQKQIDCLDYLIYSLKKQK